MCVQYNGFYRFVCVQNARLLLSFRAEGWTLVFDYGIYLPNLLDFLSVSQQSHLTLFADLSPMHNLRHIKGAINYSEFNRCLLPKGMSFKF